MTLHGFAWNFIAGAAVIGFILVIVMNQLRKSAQKSRDSFARAVRGVARVLQVGKSSPSLAYGGDVTELLLQVHRSGVEPYELPTIWVIRAAAPKVQTGLTFNVKVDPLDRQKIYSAETWAQSLGVLSRPIDTTTEG